MKISHLQVLKTLAVKVYALEMTIKNLSLIEQYNKNTETVEQTLGLKFEEALALTQPEDLTPEYLQEFCEVLGISVPKPKDEGSD